MAQMIAMRLTELSVIGSSGPVRSRRAALADLINIAEQGLFIVPIDNYMDCRDAFELMCGSRGIPSDKSQRLSTLSLREDRLTGRLRYTILTDTVNMLADGLTKPGLFESLMGMLSSGYWTLRPHPAKPCCIRFSVKQSTVTEDDLVKLDR